MAIRVYVYTTNTANVCVRGFDGKHLIDEIYGDYPKSEKETIIRQLKEQHGEDVVQVW